MNKSNNNIDNKFSLFALGTGFSVLFTFGLVRLGTGETLIGIIDLIISFFILLITIQYWHKGHSQKMNLMFVVICIIGMLSIMPMKPSQVSYWAFPIITATFFLIELRIALAINISFIGVTLGVLWSRIPFPEFASITAALLLVCVFGYVFSARSELHKKMLRTRASRDGLTGIRNRRSLDEQIAEIVAAFPQKQADFSMIMLDLDHFKTVNDVYGHTVGDSTLINFVALISSAIRETDKIYRFGGEEFVILAENTPLKNAGKLAEDLRGIIESDLHVKKLKNITVSIGVSNIAKNDSASDWLSRADSALYKAKDSGRNIVFLATRYESNNKIQYKAVTKNELINTKMKKAYQSIQTDSAQHEKQKITPKIPIKSQSSTSKHL